MRVPGFAPQGVPSTIVFVPIQNQVVAETTRREIVVPRIVWACALIALLCWAFSPGYVVGWDLDVYKAAIVSLRAGHDPYLDATNIQRVFHAQGPHPPGTATPFAYVYSPITLPLLKLVEWWPFALSATLYWTIFFAAVLATAWVGRQFAEGHRERVVFSMLAPLALFFPGLLEQDVIFSGNVAYILYAAVLLAALLGWKRGTWWPFYVAVVVASCFKAPLLSLVAIAPLSARGQWWKALGTCVAGVALFVVQPHLWPSLFHNYLEAVELQFSFNKDFSSSPAGLIAKLLYDHAPYQKVWAATYGAYALVFSVMLLLLRQRYLRGELTQKQWIPVVLLGTILLNPRIMEYDVAPLPLVMALIVWRFFALVGKGSLRTAIVGLAVVFALGNAVISMAKVDGSIDWWRPTEGVLLVLVLVAGCWTLWREARSVPVV